MGRKGAPGFLQEWHGSVNLLLVLLEAFREICPAGHGYTYSSSDIRLSMRKAEEEELSSSLREQTEQSSGPPPGAAERQSLRAATATWIEAETLPDKGI